MTDETQAPPVDPKPASAAGAASGTAAADGATAPNGARRRRRRGGRGRGRPRSAASTATDAEASDTGTKSDADSASGSKTAAKSEDKESGGSGATRPRTRTSSRSSSRSASRAPRTRPTPKPTDASDETKSGESKPAETGASSEDGATAKPAARRRSRRGGRGRGRGTRPQPKDADAKDPAEDSSKEKTPASKPSTRSRPKAGESEASDGEDSAAKPPARRRRRRGSGSTKSAAKAKKTDKEGAEDEPSLDDPPEAVKARRASRSRKKKPEDDNGIAKVDGPTRLRRGRGAGTTRTRTRRRREPMIIPERITDKQMVITEHGERDQIAILEERTLVQHYVTRAGAKSMVGNIYLGRVQNVLPGMEAAFLDVGRGRNAVLYAGEVNYSAEELEGDTPPRIQDVLKSGQSVLVQVTKDPMGGKGARLTAQVSVPGRYLVMVPNSTVFGISRRIPDDERKRLKAIAKKMRPEEHGLIVRTAAEDVPEEALVADLDRVVKTWKEIDKKARSRKTKAPDLLYEEPELTVRVVRDLFTGGEFKELVTDSPRIHEKVMAYLGDVAPDLAAKVHLHEGKLSAFEEFHIEEQIHKALDRKVWLPSGGYLIIERTEALTVVDVNTGKSVGRTNLEETVVNTNLEAAQEVAHQLRLRDIGGIIVIDLIDMLLEKNKQKVMDTLKEAMAQDKTRSQVFEIGPLGLLEVTRKRVSGGLLESFSETCPTCEGRGILVNYEPGK